MLYILLYIYNNKQTTTSKRTIMNLEEKFEQFMSYYKEKMKVVGDVIICSAKNSKDQKIKRSKDQNEKSMALHHIIKPQPGCG